MSKSKMKDGVKMGFKKFVPKLQEPEYYMEIQDHDVRLSVLKANDMLETLYDASISVTYADEAEYPDAEEMEKKLVRRIHTRHALLDLNNCFDLLLQVPWFHFRIWEQYNPGGPLRTNDRRTHNNITRNATNWVKEAEENCSYLKMVTYLKQRTDPDTVAFVAELKQFRADYIFNQVKPFTVRTIANQMKHNHSLKLEEFHAPYDFNVEINGVKSNLKDNQLYLKMDLPFYTESNPSVTLGTVKVEMKDDLYVDVLYTNGDKFYAKDYLKENSRYRLNDIHQELIDYGNALIDLYEKLLLVIEPNLAQNPSLIPMIMKESKTINLDKYFKN